MRSPIVAHALSTVDLALKPSKRRCLTSVPQTEQTLMTLTLDPESHEALESKEVLDSRGMEYRSSKPKDGQCLILDLHHSLTPTAKNMDRMTIREAHSWKAGIESRGGRWVSGSRSAEGQPESKKPIPDFVIEHKFDTLWVAKKTIGPEKQRRERMIMKQSPEEPWRLIIEGHYNGEEFTEYKRRLKKLELNYRRMLKEDEDHEGRGRGKRRKGASMQDEL